MASNAKKYADMHLSWNNIWMFTKGGQKRGQQKNFYKLMDLYLSPWFGVRLLDKYGFTPQMIGIKKYIKGLENLGVIKKQVLVPEEYLDPLYDDLNTPGYIANLHKLFEKSQKGDLKD